MKLEAKIKNPIDLKLSSQENILLSGSEKLPLESGAIFAGEHFGFNLTVNKNGHITTTTYPTQCRIYGVQMHAGILHIFEDHKYLPWKFSSDGTFLSDAVFSNLKKDELAYIFETYGLQTAEEIKELNNYRKTIIRWVPTSSQKKYNMLKL